MCGGDRPRAVVVRFDYNGGMEAPTYYVETSVWGSLATRQPRDRKEVVRRLLTLLDGIRGSCVISEAVLGEIALAAPAEAASIQQYVEKVKPVVYPLTEAVESLARAYLAAGVLPERREADALHVAVATCFGAD